MGEVEDKLELLKTMSGESFVVLNEKREEQSPEMSDNGKEEGVTKEKEVLNLKTVNGPLELDGRSRESKDETKDYIKGSMYETVLKEFQKKKNVSSDWHPPTREGYRELYHEVFKRLLRSTRHNKGTCELDNYHLFKELSAFPSVRLEKPLDLVEKTDGFSLFMSERYEFLKHYKVASPSSYRAAFEVFQLLQHQFMVCGVPYLEWSKLSLYFFEQSFLYRCMDSPKFSYNMSWCEFLILLTEVKQGDVPKYLSR